MLNYLKNWFILFLGRTVSHGYGPDRYGEFIAHLNPYL